MPFMEISHSAKIGTVVGSIDLVKLTGSDPSACLLPGLIAQSHRGILFVDEINRLADTSPELADVLLDVMGTKPGRIQIEEVGLPKVEMSVQVCVWAASNPDEEPGSLAGIRRQLSDRFDLLIPIKRPTDVDSVAKILLQSVEGGSGLSNPWADIDFTSLARHLGDVSLSSEIYHLTAGIYVDFNIESLRAMEALLLAARLSAAQRGSHEVQLVDLRRYLALTLGHRLEPSVLDEIDRYLEQKQRQEQALAVLSQPGIATPQPGPTSGLEDHIRPLSGAATYSDDYRQSPMPLSNMLNQLLHKLWGSCSAEYMPSVLPPSQQQQPEIQQRAGSGITGGHQTGVGPGLHAEGTDLLPVAPRDTARPIAVLSYTEIIKSSEEIKP